MRSQSRMPPLAEFSRDAAAQALRALESRRERAQRRMARMSCAMPDVHIPMQNTPNIFTYAYDVPAGAMSAAVYVSCHARPCATPAGENLKSDERRRQPAQRKERSRCRRRCAPRQRCRRGARYVLPLPHAASTPNPSRRQMLAPSSP